MTEFHEEIARLVARDDGSFTANPDDSWRQGRTLFGGMSAALCYAACERVVPDLPPLRSAQIAYVGPSLGETSIHPTILRRGKSVTFMGCDMLSEGTVATRALFVFGGDRPSAFADTAPAPPEVPAPDACPPLWPEGFGPTFAQHIAQRQAGPLRPMSGADKGDLIIWVRLRDPNLPAGLVSLVALGDALPPASFPRMTQGAMISTITWQFDLCDPAGFDPNQWHLLRSTDDALGNGYAGQSMAMWDEAGKPVLLARQSVAIFA
jgi:acyl-CoA thioesterase